jgi:hypothetical protein
MKRAPNFLNASWIRFQLERACVTALLVVALFALLGKAAHAQQSCGDISEQPETVYSDMLDILAGYFPIEDAGVCGKIVKAAVGACHRAVADAEGCLGNLVGSTLKAAKSACGTTSDPSACTADAKEQAEASETGVGVLADEAHAVCDGEFAESFSEACLSGLDPV